MMRHGFGGHAYGVSEAAYEERVHGRVEEVSAEPPPREVSSRPPPATLIGPLHREAGATERVRPAPASRNVEQLELRHRLGNGRVDHQVLAVGVEAEQRAESSSGAAGRPRLRAAGGRVFDRDMCAARG